MTCSCGSPPQRILGAEILWSLEFSQRQVTLLTAENKSLRNSVRSLTRGMTKISGEVKTDERIDP